MWLRWLGLGLVNSLSLFIFDLHDDPIFSYQPDVSYRFFQVWKQFPELLIEFFKSLNKTDLGVITHIPKLLV
jgi:hypothetical protein